MRHGLLLCLKDGSWEVRGEAAAAVAVLGEPDDVERLFPLLSEEDAFVRDAAAEAILAMRSPKNLDAYRRRLAEPPWSLAWQAAHLATYAAGEGADEAVVRGIAEGGYGAYRAEAVRLLAVRPSPDLGLFLERLLRTGQEGPTLEAVVAALERLCEQRSGGGEP